MSVTKEQQEILSLVSQFGCLDIEQLKILMEPYEKKTVNMLVNALIKKHMLSEVTIKNSQSEDQRGITYLVPFGNEKSFKHSIISCVWVMLDVTASKEEIKESIRAEAPAMFYFTSGRKESFEIMYVDSNNLFKLNTIQERYKMRNKHKSKVISENYIILVVGSQESNDQENMDLIKTIYNYDLEMPFILAMVSHSGYGRPVVKKFKSTPKNVQNQK